MSQFNGLHVMEKRWFVRHVSSVNNYNNKRQLTLFVKKKYCHGQQDERLWFRLGSWHSFKMIENTQLHQAIKGSGKKITGIACGAFFVAVSLVDDHFALQDSLKKQLENKQYIDVRVLCRRGQDAH